MSAVIAPTSQVLSVRKAFRPVLPYLGVAPFFLFALLFLILPTLSLITGAFQDKAGNFTLDNLFGLGQPQIMAAYTISLQISVASAFFGAVFGALMAYAAISGGLPRWIRPTLTTFSGVASNFAGVPLAFAFLATVGRLGIVTMVLRDVFGFNLYSTGFNLLSFFGLTLVYLYFQIPLMILIFTPAIDGVKKEWREASQILGAARWQYWRYVAGPVLWPSFLGSFLLLFANAFGAVATAFALTGSSLNIITIQLFAQIRGDALHNQNLGYAMAFGMIVITGASNIAYIWLRSRSERWLK